MFSQVTRKIYGMESDIAAANSRISECENSIYHIKSDNCTNEPLWNRAIETTYKVDELTSTVIELQSAVEELKASLELVSANLNELATSIGPKAEASTVEPKVKTDLEIFEQNDPFITPQYYLDAREKDYWYWNGED